MLRRVCLGASLLAALSGAVAQETRDLGLPPPSGSQNPVLPPPSGSQNPVLPPETGRRYLPGIGGRFGEEGGVPRSVPRRSAPAVGEIGIVGSVDANTAPRAGEIGRLSEIGAALRRCWQPPAEVNAIARVRFSLRRDGSLFGEPRITWEASRADAGDRAAFAASVVAAVRDCTPVRLSRKLGEGIAGRPLTLRFHGRAPSTERPI